MASGALAAGVSAPRATGPVSLEAGGCQTGYGCSYDFLLASSAAPDPSVAWHALWVDTAAVKGQRGWCNLDAIANLTWDGGSLPIATYPHGGSITTTGASTAELPLDAAGKATAAGRLSGEGMPAGMVTTWVGRGHVISLWQGRATVDPQLVMAAELANPVDPLPPSSGQANDLAVGLPCDDFAPPGNTFLARFAHSTIRLGQTAYLELRIPKTGLRWILTPTRNEQTALTGTATVQITGGVAGLQSHTKPQVLHFADRWTFETKPGFGTWTAIVSMRGPTGSRHYRVHLTVRA